MNHELLRSRVANDPDYHSHLLCAQRRRADCEGGACGGLSARTEDAALRQIEAAGGVTTSVVTLVTALTRDFSTDLGRKAFGILQSLRPGAVIGGEPDTKPVKKTFRADDGLEIVYVAF